MRIAVLIVLMLTVAACGRNRVNFNEFDGVSFRSGVKSEDNTRYVFNATVRPFSASEEGAREAGRYEGTKHCINHFGTSDIEWLQGPDDAELVVNDDTLELKGRCVE